MAQRRIGLTGGIATGKSTVARLLEERFDLPVLDADRFAHGALGPGTTGTEAVLARYGQRVRDRSAAEPTIDRTALGRIVFADPAERTWLEGLVHPVVRQRFAERLEALAAAPTVVLMIPLLYEAGLEGLCSEVWLVNCDQAEQLRRLMARDGLGEAEAIARIAAQWPMARKRARADVVIDNGDRCGDADLEQQLARALSPSAAR
ncbi:dephospho-CoA kinase [Synechococcus sp. CCY 9618]|uniref:dephospho-CoA kinase n=1 Tax=Synechococcus sp. CCY 9618 TaxID=2815602 RepID=UPI001C235740|nr:dephospho-CoA kinase [Synechococcus sp. CCY 9618]